MSENEGNPGESRPTARGQAAASILLGSLATTLIVTVQAAILVPLYVKHVGPRLYGAWLGSGDFLVWMQTFDLGLPNLMIQRIAKAHGEGDDRAAGAWFATGTAVLALIALGVCVAGCLFAFLLPRALGLGEADGDTLRRCFQAATAASSVNLFTYAFMGFAKAVQDTALLTWTAVAGAIAGLLASTASILTGGGLWALPIGLAARSAVILLGSMAFALRYRTFIRLHGALDNSIAREFAAISPITALGNFSYTLMNQSDTALVALLKGPEIATVYSVSKKLVDAARSLIDQIAAATYGGFSHLVASNDRARAMEVHAEIRAARSALAVTAAVVCIVVNKSLVSLWIGGQYGGPLLTFCLALQLITAGDSYLVNYLYRAAGFIRTGSIALAAEALLRVPLAAAFLLWIGLAGAPASGVLVSLAFAAFLLRRTTNALSAAPGTAASSGWPATTVRMAVLALAAVAGAAYQQRTWLQVSAAALLSGLAALTLLYFTDSRLHGLRTRIPALRQVRPA